MWVYLYPNNTETELKNAYIWIPFPTSIVLDKSSISLTTVGQTEQLTATIEPTVSDKTITWSSDDTTVATVSTTGLVTCVTPWECTITATTVNGLTATCSVSLWSPNRDLSLATRWPSYDYGSTWVMSAFVSNDWLHMYILNESSNTVREYSLSTAYDISTASIVTTVSTSGTPHQCWLSNDWTKLFVCCWSGYIDEFVMLTPYSLSTATKTAHNYWTNVWAIFFSEDWMIMCIAQWGSWIRKYELSSPFAYDVSWTYTQTSWDWDIRWACVSNDWLHFFVFANGSSDILYEYTLNSAYNFPTNKSATHQSKQLPITWSRIELVGNLTQNQKYLYVTDEYRYIYRLDISWN